jgi:hypothetical protein
VHGASVLGIISPVQGRMLDGRRASQARVTFGPALQPLAAAPDLVVIGAHDPRQTGKGTLITKFFPRSARETSRRGLANLDVGY